MTNIINNITSKTIIIGLTSGEPAGIGPELIDDYILHFIKLIKEKASDKDTYKEVASNYQFKYIGDLNLLNQTTQHYFKTQGSYQQINVATPVIKGVLNPKNNDYVLQTLAQSAHLALNKNIDAIVTLPVHKGILNEANSIEHFSGHTEFFAQKSGLKPHDVLMLLAGTVKTGTVKTGTVKNDTFQNTLRVALATTHVPLQDVAKHLTVEKICHVLTLLHEGLKTQFHIDNPIIHVCGLNPHAGDNGALGCEEQIIISPAIELMKKQGLNVFGPFSADTVFHHQGVDAFLAMYHDQGLPVLKYATFGHAVNITLGLPFIRTSVDHGTALDIAGKGIADVGSLAVAIETAIYCAKGKIGLVK